MNVRKFIAATARDALRKVKETLGPDAIILSNRGIPGGVEIMAVAARDMEMIVPTPEREPHLAARNTVGCIARCIARCIAHCVAQRRLPRGNRRSCAPCRQHRDSRMPVPALARAALGGQTLAADGGAAVAIASSQRSEAGGGGGSGGRDGGDSLAAPDRRATAGRVSPGASPRVPEPVKTEILRQMLDAGFSPQFARDLLADLPRELDAGQALAWVKGVPSVAC
jgi:flagellar biosynthesis protein FlhF